MLPLKHMIGWLRRIEHGISARPVLFTAFVPATLFTWHVANCFSSVLQVDPKFLRNMRFAKKHNKKGLKAARKAAKDK